MEPEHLSTDRKAITFIKLLYDGKRSRKAVIKSYRSYRRLGRSIEESLESARGNNDPGWRRVMNALNDTKPIMRAL